MSECVLNINGSYCYSMLRRTDLQIPLMSHLNCIGFIDCKYFIEETLSYAQRI